jgi:hypothetical protein
MNGMQVEAGRTPGFLSTLGNHLRIVLGVFCHALAQKSGSAAIFVQEKLGPARK